MKIADLKLNDRQTLDDQINEFFAKGKTIEQVPINRYQHENLTQTNIRTMLETSVGKLTAEQRKSYGEALRAKDRQAWTLREMAGK